MAISHLRRSPAPGYHDASARSFVYDVVALSSVDYKHFIGDAVCSAELPPFATSDSQPFKQLAQIGSVGDEIRKMNDYAPALVAHALSIVPVANPIPGQSSSSTPTKRSKPTGCALPGCNNAVYPGMDYCGASHAIAAGALHPGSASWNPALPALPLPAAAPVSGVFGFPPPFPAQPLGGSAPFASPPLGVAQPLGPLPSVPPLQSPGALAAPVPPLAASPLHGNIPLVDDGRSTHNDGGRGKGGKGGGRGRGRARGGKGSGGRGGSIGFAATCRQLNNSGHPPAKGSLAQQFVQRSATHVGVQFGADGPVVIDKSKAAQFCGCGPDDKCWGTLMCMSAKDRLALCEHPQHHADNAPQHVVPSGFHDAMRRGDFR